MEFNDVLKRRRTVREFADRPVPEAALRRAEATTGRDGLFHESVHADDPRRFSRRWFSWADMLHVELVLRSAGVEV